MQTGNRFFDDLARVANSALGAAAGLRNEIEAMIRDRLQRMTADMDLVPREEFEAVKEMAARARTEQETYDVGERIPADCERPDLDQYRVDRGEWQGEQHAGPVLRTCGRSGACHPADRIMSPEHGARPCSGLHRCAAATMLP